MGKSHPNVMRCVYFANVVSWHADVKPDNIIFVRDVFKLADFGFAEFMRREEALESPPKAHKRGGTNTYGMD